MQKRKHMRADTNILVDLFSEDALVNMGRGCVVNISFSGLAIETESKLEIDSNVLMDVRLPNAGKPLEIHAKVVRQQDMGNVFRYGLRYTRIPMHKRIYLFLYIHNWLKW